MTFLQLSLLVALGTTPALFGSGSSAASQSQQPKTKKRKSGVLNGVHTGGGSQAKKARPSSHVDFARLYELARNGGASGDYRVIGNTLFREKADGSLLAVWRTPTPPPGVVPNARAQAQAGAAAGEQPANAGLLDMLVDVATKDRVAEEQARVRAILSGGNLDSAAASSASSATNQDDDVEMVDLTVPAASESDVKVASGAKPKKKPKNSGRAKLQQFIDTYKKAPKKQYKNFSDDFDTLMRALEPNARLTALDELGATILHYVAVNGTLEQARQLQQRSPDEFKKIINKLGEHNRTALFELVTFAENPTVEFVQFLIESGIDINAKEGGIGSTALHEAVKIGNVAIVELLLKHNAQQDIVDNSRYTALELARRFKNKATRAQMVALFKPEVQNGALADAASAAAAAAPANCASAADAAADLSATEQLAQLIARLSDGDYSEDIQNTELLKQVKDLAKEGADLNVKAGKKQDTIMHIAAAYCLPSLIRLLKFDAHKRPRPGALGVRNVNNETPLQTALLYGDETISVYKLLADRATVDNRTSSQETALHIAHRGNMSAVVDYLVDHCGADYTLQDKDGNVVPVQRSLGQLPDPGLALALLISQREHDSPGPKPAASAAAAAPAAQPVPMVIDSEVKEKAAASGNVASASASASASSAAQPMQQAAESSADDLVRGFLEFSGADKAVRLAVLRDILSMQPNLGFVDATGMTLLHLGAQDNDRALLEEIYQANPQKFPLWFTTRTQKGSPLDLVMRSQHPQSGDLLDWVTSKGVQVADQIDPTIFAQGIKPQDEKAKYLFKVWFLNNKNRAQEPQYFKPVALSLGQEGAAFMADLLRKRFDLARGQK